LYRLPGRHPVFRLIGALVAERAEAGWYPATARMWFPAAGGECRPRWPQAAPFPLGGRLRLRRRREPGLTGI
jgi:hypothetical protein